MSKLKESGKAAKIFRTTLSCAAIIAASTSILGAWGSQVYNESLLINLILGITAAWAVICHQAEGLVRGRVLNLRIPTFFFLAFAMLSPAPLILLTGALLGAVLYLLLLAYISTAPRVTLIAGDRYYRLHHPLELFIPMTNLAPVPLSPLFDPVTAFHWQAGPFNIRIWKVSVFDPLSLHKYIQSNASKLTSVNTTWYDAVTCFRRALGLLYLLDSLRRFEEIDLDGVALAASARLALANIPENSRDILYMALRTLNHDRQNQILSAFDLKISRV